MLLYTALIEGVDGREGDSCVASSSLGSFGTRVGVWRWSGSDSEDMVGSFLVAVEYAGR